MSYLLQQLLMNSAKRHPDGGAVFDKNNSISYRELETVSNQFAHTLVDAGVERGDRVGIYLDKSIEAVIAIFGILKTGTAYVPLDPTAPTTRVAFIIHDCQMKALVSTGAKMTALAKSAADKLDSIQSAVLTDNEAETSHRSRQVMEDEKQSPIFNPIRWSEVLQMPSTPPPDPGLIGDDLAYILYTSGSTGTPKGVMISHRAALTFVNWAYDTFAVQPTDRVSNHAPLHFDLSIFDIFTTIKAGGAIVLVPAALSSFPISLANFIAAQEITIWYSVPSALTRLVLYGKLEQHTYSHLHTVLFAGEVFPTKYLRQLMEKIPHAEYHNLYGPTETNVCTYYTVPPLAPERVEPIPIGVACANSEVFVLNEQNEIVTLGEIGELCVRGPGLMKGYWGMAEKSQEVLVPLTVHPTLGPETIYRTGDLVKEAPDGNYLYLGRRDNMIKSRGYRIELGEIETALYSHPDIEEVAVIPVPDDEIGNLIKAVVVTRNGDRLKPEGLESFCAERLPKYMIPHVVEFRSALPKTSTGKVNKTQLRSET
jgi:amino acid adenylation domain-containing protein